jgi:two-component system, response regulator
MVYNTINAEILLAEDNPADAELVLRALKRNNPGDRVAVVKDGLQALDFVFARGEFSNRVFENNPKLILMDLNLPRLGGIEALRAIKQNNRTRNIPIIVLTSSTEEKDINRSYLEGANSYIVKSGDFEKFSESINSLRNYWILINQVPSP